MTFTGFAEFCFCSRAVLHNLRLEVLSGLLLLKIWRHQLLWVVWQWVRQQTTRSWSLVTLSLLWPSARNYTFYCHTEAWTSARRHYENFGFVGKRNMRIIRSMKPFLMKNCVWHYQFDCMEMKGEAPWSNSYWFFLLPSWALACIFCIFLLKLRQKKHPLWSWVGSLHWVVVLRRRWRSQKNYKIFGNDWILLAILKSRDFCLFVRWRKLIQMMVKSFQLPFDTLCLTFRLLCLMEFWWTIKVSKFVSGLLA